MVAPPRHNLVDGVLSVSIRPPEKPCFNNHFPSYRHEIPRPTAIVEGVRGMMLHREIVPVDRFATYGKDDLIWAVPLGLCRVHERPFERGDLVPVSHFMPDEKYEAYLICTDIRIEDHVGELTREILEFDFVSEDYPLPV